MATPSSLQILAMAAVLLLLQLFFATATATKPPASNASATLYPNFQHLNVKDVLAGTQLIQPNEYHQLFEFEAKPEADKEARKGELKLVHRDKFISLIAAAAANSTHDNYHHRFKQRIRRDATRVAALIRRLEATGGGGGHEYKVADFGSEVVSGMEQGSGEYFVRIGVGSPPRSQYMVIDSGSDIVWVQCQPCNQCYRQSDPVFDPANSASFAGVSCSSAVCDRLENSGCHEGRCRYEVLYGDGSYTKGTLALETLTFGRTAVRNVAIGCGHRNQGMFVGAAGLLGLGGGSLSFVGQLGGQTGGAFSYCLVSRGTSSTGSLDFGQGALPVGAAWVPLLSNPRAPSFYFIGLAGLGVGGVRLPIPEDLFRLTETGDGGVVMDTGTAVTRFPVAAYGAFRDAFVSQTASLPRTASGVSIFDTCYDLNGFVSVRVPTVSFYFTGGPILTLPARNFLIPVDEAGTFCFAFAASPSGLSIIGNIQQEGIQISFDGANGFAGFGPNVC
ncbi:protein ASPARTIC PROTEASE IN GUARD CELL 2 [Diospyros lotus]|uniref:protein ASPARTIC PROTEASE IN GUARD CELL 2 n=1 Tax=Diospyros lotus TaxID=55363 RepID=UPI002258ECB3|nr:protein ASPARTIC PROTEASE IN GUARD CELL 2 [Diospyros lotus]